MSRTFLYARVSTAEQTTDNQLLEARSAGFAILPRHTVEETISGSVPAAGCPGFSKLLDRLDEGDIRPLGAPHDGPDVAGNIIVLCPNHHVLFDYGALTLDADKLSIVHGHYIEEQYVEYHNEIIASSKRAEF